jgi:hypothetical protein
VFQADDSPSSSCGSTTGPVLPINLWNAIKQDARFVGISPRFVAVSPFFHGTSAPREGPMPSLFRFLTFIGVLGGLAYGTMFMLATWYDPKPREITVTIPADRFVKQQ